MKVRLISTLSLICLVLSGCISNPNTLAMGALGAGGGGFLLVYINKKKQKNFLSKIRNITNIPFKFSNEGCEVILNSLNK